MNNEWIIFILVLIMYTLIWAFIDRTRHPRPKVFPSEIQDYKTYLVWSIFIGVVLPVGFIIPLFKYNTLISDNYWITNLISIPLSLLYLIGMYMRNKQ